MGLLSYTKKKSRKMMDCFCCFKFLCTKKKKMPQDEKSKRKKRLPKDETMKKKLFSFKRKSKKQLTDANKKKKKLFCFQRKNKQQLTDENYKKKKKKKLFCFQRKNKQQLTDENYKKKKRKLFFLRRKKKKLANDEKKKKTMEEKKKTWRKRKLKMFWGRKKGQKKGDNLMSLVKSISLKSDSGNHRSVAEEILRIGSDNIAARVFTYRELAAATRNFRSENLLGEGGFGRVYKGQVKGTNEIVAVKQLDRKGLQGSREFLVEVLMLSLLHHPNLVKMLGYCADGDQRILVYEYMPMGSLRDHLIDLSPNAKPLDWYTRMKIAAGAARGLEHLHEVATPPVIYRDFKASNILLDEDYNAKLSDFGLAKVGPSGDNSHVSTRVMGTYGYCAPEYASTGKLTKMSDIYSFGVVFLELITGRKAIDITRPKHEQRLVHWAIPLFKEKRQFVTMADPRLEGKHPVKGLYQALAVAAICLQEEATMRPRISDVLTAIEHLANPKNDDINSPIESIPQNIPTSSLAMIP